MGGGGGCCWLFLHAGSLAVEAKRHPLVDFTSSLKKMLLPFVCIKASEPSAYVDAVMLSRSRVHFGGEGEHRLAK